MKKSEFKKIIKPIVEECIEESIHKVLFESGVIGQIVSEVMQNVTPVLTESRKNSAFVIEDDDDESLIPTKKKRKASPNIKNAIQEMKETLSNSYLNEDEERTVQSEMFLRQNHNYFEEPDPLNEVAEFVAANDLQGRISDQERDVLFDKLGSRWKHIIDESNSRQSPNQYMDIIESKKQQALSVAEEHQNKQEQKKKKHASSKG